MEIVFTFFREIRCTNTSAHADIHAYGIRYIICGVAFWFADSTVAKQFPLPESVVRFHVTRWWPALDSRMPDWCPLWVAIATLYVSVLLGWATAILSLTEVVLLIAVVINGLQWVPVLRVLKASIDVRRQSGQPVLALRIRFGLWLCEPFVMMYILFTSNLPAATVLGVVVAAVGTVVLREDPAKTATSPAPSSPLDAVLAESARRINRLRPKHRALLLDAGAGP